MAIRKLNFRRILVLTGIISLLVIYPILYVRTLSSPQDRTGADFISFYTAGRIAQDYGAQAVYDIGLQKTIQQAIVGFDLVESQVLIYIHSPFIVPALQVIMTDNYVFSFVRWSLFCLLLYCVSIALLLDTVVEQSTLFKKKSLLFIVSITFFPLFVSIVNGQDTAFLFLGLSLWVWGFSKSKDGAAGIGLALATLRPHVALMLALPFIFKRHKIFLWFLASAAALGLFSYLLIGPGGMKSFLALLLLTAKGEGFGVNQDKMVNVLGLMLRLFPMLPLKTMQSMAWVLYISAIIGLCILWIKSRSLDIRHLATAILTAVLFVPHLHYHDLTLILIPMIILILFREDLLFLNDLPELPLIISALLLFSGSILIIKLTVPYIVIAALLTLLWLPREYWHKSEKDNIPVPL